MSHKRIVYVFISVVILGVISASSYLVAGRYSGTRADAVAVSTDARDSSAAAVTSPTSGGSGDLAPQDTRGIYGAVEYTATDTSYTSATKTISITKVTEGTGSDIVTYYVADVELAPGTSLQSAFAGGRFDSDVVENTSEIAEDNSAILAINGDYYSARTDGVIIRNGVLYRDLPTRVGLALYKNGTMQVYDETKTSAQQLLADGVWNTYSFGPALIEDGVVAANLDAAEVSGDRHSIRGDNPRTGIGIIDQNHFVFVVVDGRQQGYSTGVTLSEFAQIFEDLGCTTAYNLDGGGSSTMYFMGNLVNSPSGKGGERSVSDILFVG